MSRESLRRPSRFGRAWRTALLAACVVGCGGGESGPDRHPVRGRVLYKSKPIADAMVVFHPLHAAMGVRQRPVAVTGPDGRFTLTTIRPGDGALVGDYAVTVELRELRPDGDEMIRDGRNLLPEKYRDPQTSGLNCTVGERDNDLPPFELK